MPFFGSSSSTDVKETLDEAVNIALTKASVCYNQSQYSMGVDMLRQLLSNRAVHRSQIVKVKEKLAYGLEMDSEPSEALRVYQEILCHHNE
jgi:hypothetical protein